MSHYPDTFHFVYLRKAPPDADHSLVLFVKNQRTGVTSILGFDAQGRAKRWPESMDSSEAERLGAQFLRVHLCHCCPKHGCQYEDHGECPVAMGLAGDGEDCATCWDEEAWANHQREIVDSFSVCIEDDKLVGVSFADESLWLTPEQVLYAAAMLVKGAYDVEGKQGKDTTHLRKILDLISVYT